MRSRSAIPDTFRRAGWSSTETSSRPTSSSMPTATLSSATLAWPERSTRRPVSRPLLSGRLTTWARWGRVSVRGSTSCWLHWYFLVFLGGICFAKIAEIELYHPFTTYKWLHYYLVIFVTIIKRISTYSADTKLEISKVSLEPKTLARASAQRRCGGGGLRGVIRNGQRPVTTKLLYIEVWPAVSSYLSRSRGNALVDTGPAFVLKLLLIPLERGTWL